MKYSLKNRQFGRRNQIFAERKKEEHPTPKDFQDLAQIREDARENEDSTIIPCPDLVTHADKLYQFIDFQGSQHAADPPGKGQQRTHSNEPLRGRHGLSPISKPLLNNPNIRLTESQIRLRQSKSFDIESETVSFCYRPGKSMRDNSKEIKQLKAVFLKLYSVLLSNNSRIDQLQMVAGSILEGRNLILRQLSQGLRAAVRVQTQSDLYLNTIRSVYQNLRICKLKQQNLELYFKQSLKKRPDTAEPQQDRTLKIQPPKYSLTNKQYESDITENQLQSRQLAQLIDYQSELSLDAFRPDELQPQIPFEESSFNNNRIQTQHNNVLDEAEEERCEPQTACQQLSPFEANRMISITSQPSHFRSVSQSHTSSQFCSRHAESQFETFRTGAQSQVSNEVTRLKNWLRTTSQLGLRCWLDEMRCLRRSNNTYIFNQRGEVIRLERQSFSKLIKQGYLASSQQQQ